MKKRYNYYTLYKAIKDTEGNTIDAENIADFSSYEEIRNNLHCINRDIKKMIYNNINNLEKINLFKNQYFIIKD